MENKFSYNNGRYSSKEESELLKKYRRVTYNMRKRKFPLPRDYDSVYTVSVKNGIVSFFLGKKTIDGEHLCSTCKRCYALPESQGGCSKVLDNYFLKRIERYYFIKTGYEIVFLKSKSDTGTTDRFCVQECSHYIAAPKNKKV